MHLFPSRTPVLLLGCAALAVLLLLAACAAPEEQPTASLRLIDLFPEARLEASPEPLAIDATGRSWTFADEGAEAWTLGQDVAGLRLDDGLLVGRTTSDMPLVHVERTGPPGADLLHEVEVRARVSAGTNLTFVFQDELAVPAVVRSLRGPFPPTVATPLLPGEEMQTYRIRPSRAVELEGIRHVVLRPTDAAGADFAIESVRLISRSEHLASIPSGIGWHGLSSIYRETLVSRAPESIRFALRLPSRPRLEVAIGTLDARPLTFRVRLRAAGAEPVELVARTRTRPLAWEDLSLDLAAWAGRDVELELALQAQADGALGFWGSPAVRGAGTARPVGGVVVFLADTLRADRLDPYGHSRQTAPHLARMARQGAIFKHCTSQATWTKVSVSSIMSGLYPLSHGVIGFTDRLPAAATTVAESFRDAGWATLSMSSISFFGEFTNLHQGFEVFHESRSLPEGLRSKTARTYMDRFLPWLDEHHDVPFFAVVHVADPHSPFEPYAPYDTMYASAGARAEHEADVAKVEPEIESPLMKRFRMPNRAELEKVGISPDAYVARELDWYDASIRALDAEVGRLLERLDELGIADSTVVAFVADHGEEFLEHGRHWHGHAVYGELSHVPLLLRGPGIDAGTVVEETVQTIDLAPTLLALAGLTPDERMQGQDLRPLLAAGPGRAAGVSWRPRPAFTGALSEGQGADADEPWPSESYGMRDGHWMLVHNVQRPQGMAELELYDQRTDPLHQNDVAAANPEVVEGLAAKITAWKALAESQRIADDTDLEGLDAAELERLRSLGYVN